jgi:hypothetical protein
MGVSSRFGTPLDNQAVMRNHNRAVVGRALAGSAQAPLLPRLDNNPDGHRGLPGDVVG